MWGTVIAVLGTLGGVALAGATQVLTERRARREQQRQLIADAVQQLLGAVMTYREAHWLLIADIREGEQDNRETRTARYRARSEITRAFDRLSLVTADPQLVQAASAALWAAVELSHIDVGQAAEGRFAEHVETALAAGRERTREAHNALRAAATAHVHRRPSRTSGT
ncbi:hypothetical protein [Streptomyces aureocirculatus]|uniref:hypothetical protein n=1 Tax=Streptomyces aureocirculatus TaxID=67275 RepID=UPI0004CD5586|nr:hypothetical protein [Streptomyces aureocirculatus]